MPVVDERSRVRGLFSFCLLLPAKEKRSVEAREAGSDLNSESLREQGIQHFENSGE